MNEHALAVRLLDVPVAVEAPHPVQGQLVHHLQPLLDTGHPLRPGDEPTRVRLCADGAGWSVTVDDGRPSSGDDPTILTVSALTAAVVARTGLLAVHAGVLTGPHGTVVVPAASGAGKSTIVACAVRAGLGYVSDEVFAVDRSTGRIHPFPRPLVLGSAGWLLAGLPGPAPRVGEERAVPPEPAWVASSYGADPAPVSDIVLLRRADGPTALEPTTAAEGVVALLRRSFNHFRDPPGSLRRIVEIASSATVWRATYREADALADLLVRRPLPGPRSGPARCPAPR